MLGVGLEDRVDVPEGDLVWLGVSVLVRDRLIDRVDDCDGDSVDDCVARGLNVPEDVRVGVNEPDSLKVPLRVPVPLLVGLCDVVVLAVREPLEERVRLWLRLDVIDEVIVREGVRVEVRDAVRVLLAVDVSVKERVPERLAVPVEDGVEEGEGLRLLLGVPEKLAVPVADAVIETVTLGVEVGLWVTCWLALFVPLELALGVWLSDCDGLWL